MDRGVHASHLLYLAIPAPKQWVDRGFQASRLLYLAIPAPTPFFLVSTVYVDLFYCEISSRYCCVISPYFFLFPPFQNSHFPLILFSPSVYPFCALFSQDPSPCPPVLLLKITMSIYQREKSIIKNFKYLLLWFDGNIRDWKKAPNLAEMFFQDI